LLLLSLILLVSPFAAAVVTVLANGVPDSPMSGDSALLEIATRNTAEGRTLTGPYSRLGFRHPGPAYFFLRIPIYYLSDFAASSSALTVSLLGILLLTGSFLLFRCHGPALFVSLSCLIAAVFLRAIGPIIWLNDWNAFVIVLPMFFLALSLAAVSAGDSRWLLPAVLVGSFAAQTHLGCLPAVFVLFIASILTIPREKRRLDPKAWRRSILRSSLAAVLLWLPVLLQELSSAQGGNLSAMLEFVRSNRPDPFSLATIREWSASLAALEYFPMPRGFLRWIGQGWEIPALITLLRISALCICWHQARRDPGRRFLKALCAMALLSHAVTLLSVLQVRGELYQYFLVWFSFVAPLSWIAIAGIVIRVPRFDRIKGLALVPVVVLTAVVSIPSLLSGTEVLERSDSDPRIPVLSEMISDHVSSGKSASWFIELGDHELWTVMTGLVNDLQKRDLRFEVDPFLMNLTGVAPDAGAIPILMTSDSLWNPRYIEFADYGGVLLGCPPE
jgi:hypothetical protein